MSIIYDGTEFKTGISLGNGTSIMISDDESEAILVDMTRMVAICQISAKCIQNQAFINIKPID